MNARLDSSLEWVNSLLPDGTFYFQLDLVSGELRVSLGWHSRFGGRNSTTTLSTWLDTLAASDQKQLQQVLRQLACAELSRSEMVVLMTGVDGASVDVDVKMVAEILPDESVRVHGIQLLSESDLTPLITPEARRHHELANHVASIMGYAELLEATRLTPQQLGYLREILSSARRLSPPAGGRNVPEQVGRALGIESLQLTPCDVPFSTDYLLTVIRPLLDRRRRDVGLDTAIQLIWQADQDEVAIPCSVCGGCCGEGCIDVILHDSGTVIPRDQLPNFFKRGFDTADVLPSTADEDIYDAVYRLHIHGGHVAIHSTHAETTIHVYLPRDNQRPSLM